MDRSHYDDLVQKYVDRVSKLPGVLGIVLFGSVSTPGLSDIDIVVTVPDEGPWPNWEDISLRLLAKGHPAESVLAHDVFVWPKSVADNAESFFYVDQQTVLHGDRLGGKLPSHLHEPFRQLLSMDYLLHRFDSLSGLLCQPENDLRSVLLFISTLRHTCRLAIELNLISQSDSDTIFKDINSLREASLSGSFHVDLLNEWPERIVQLLWSTLKTLARQMEIDGKDVSTRQWQPNPRLIFLNSKSSDGVADWKKVMERQTKLSRYVRAAPVPAEAYSHVQRYFDSSLSTTSELRRFYPKIVGCQDNRLGEAREIRARSVMSHWRLLDSGRYNQSSGKGYLGVAKPAPPTLKSKVLQKLAVFNAHRMPRVSQARKVLLLGYYGHQNFGDDLLMKLSLDRLRANDSIKYLGVTCFSGGEDYVKSLVPYVDKIEDLSMGRKYVRKYDCVLFGGGGTIFEYRENLSYLYACRKWLSDFLDFGIANWLGTQFASIGLGIGPFSDKRGESIAMNRLKYHSLAFVRDQTSFQHAQDHNVENAVLSHDLGFLDFDNIEKAKLQRDADTLSGPCVIIRSYKYGAAKNNYAQTLLDWAASLPDSEQAGIKWVSFQPGYDAPVIDLIEQAGHQVWKWDPYNMSLQDCYVEMANASIVITARMHGTYIAGMLGIPTVSIGLHPKLTFAANYFKNSVAIAADPSITELSEAISRTTSELADDTTHEISQISENLEHTIEVINSWISNSKIDISKSAVGGA